MESGNFSEFDATSVLEGSLSVATGEVAAVEGARVGRAVINGTGTNAYSRGQWQLSWGQGTVYRTEASFYLPAGFYSAMMGAVQLLGWDAYPNLGQMRLIIWNSDKKARLFMKSDGTDSTLTNAFTVPEGRWAHLAIEQKISDSGGWSKVYLDGRLVAEGSGDTATPYSVTRIRYGIVAIDGGAQQKPLTVYFDRVRLLLPE